MSLNEDPNKELRSRVWDTAHKVIQGIENGTIDEDGVGNLEFVLSIWMAEAGWGLWPIFPSDWKRLVEANDLSDVGIDEMIHEGLNYYFDIENPMEFWEEESEDTD